MASALLSGRGFSCTSTAQVSPWSVISIIVSTCDEINKISNIVICKKKRKKERKKGGGQL